MERVITPDQLSTPQVIADLYPAHRQLSEQSPVYYTFIPAGALPDFDEPIRAWDFLKCADVYSALRDHETFSSVRPAKWAKFWPPLLLIEDDPPRHSSGVLKTYEYRSDESNRWLRTEFCPTCGTTVTGTVEALPGARMIAVGTFDDPNWIKPKASVFTRSALHWVVFPPDVEIFERYPDCHIHLLNFWTAKDEATMAADIETELPKRLNDFLQRA